MHLNSFIFKYIFKWIDILLHYRTEICTTQRLYPLRNRIPLLLILMNSLISLIPKRLYNRGIHVTVLALQPLPLFVLYPLHQLLSQTLCLRLPAVFLPSSKTLKLIRSSQMVVTTLCDRSRLIIYVISACISKQRFSLRYRRLKLKRLSTSLKIRFAGLNTTVLRHRRANQGGMRSSILLRKHSLRSGYFPLLLTVT